MRWFICLLLSVDTHLLALAGLSLSGPARPEETPPLQVSLLHLAAPAARTGTAAPETGRARRPDRPARPRAAGARVTMKVTLAKPPAPGHRQLTAAVPARCRPDAPPSRLARRPPPDPGMTPRNHVASVSDPEGNHSHPAPGPPADPADDRPGGDTRPLLEIIQARIDAVAPLVLAASRPCPRARGRARVLFIVSPAGYHRRHRVAGIDPGDCRDERIEAIIHLAEPYPYLAGWIPVSVPLAL
ncbi:MAG: hypothetical protein DRI34_06125 [Deltaproteobacteria bacterium]|nr:MAG: hypothetical protein DRI34_06125 [Deltaproteobacteria bacterium]